MLGVYVGVLRATCWVSCALCCAGYVDVARYAPQSTAALDFIRIGETLRTLTADRLETSVDGKNSSHLVTQ